LATFGKLVLYTWPLSEGYVYILDGLLYAMFIFVATIGILFFLLCLPLPEGIFVSISSAYVYIQGPVSLDCPFLIAPSVFSNVYLPPSIIMRLFSNMKVVSKLLMD
jgi:hypothetical protein